MGGVILASERSKAKQNLNFAFDSNGPFNGAISARRSAAYRTRDVRIEATIYK